MRTIALAALLLVATSCRSGQPEDRRTVVTFSGSALGAEGELLSRHVARFEQANPGIHVRIQRTPDDATQRHQLFVQWLNARAGEVSRQRGNVGANQPVRRVPIAWRAQAR